jgi:23S rRNA (guanosine2251-2'-O)-methyltransferase
MSMEGRGSVRIVCGRNAVLTVLRMGAAVREVMIDAAAAGDKAAAIVEAAQRAGVPLRRVERRELERRAGANHQGVLAVAETMPEMKLKDVLTRCADEGRPPCIVLLRELLHEHNLGAILRTADAAGADAVVLPSHGAAALGPEATRVSTGAAETVTVVRQSLTQALAVLRREGITVIGAEPEGSTDYWDQDLRGPVAFLLGGENRALSAPLRDACDALVRIPMVGQITSLNVSVACALLLYERLRQSHHRTGQAG